ncbi:hypothetical protein UFOVP210_28 [uncultured Caudovirales phage]|uniref:Uncharacterized protein n=1 Tax=uncultured Caudovirales phage TaxID=2100421 RepID=A0A6J7WP94_9CAUD|nr:hypothetical protein UFOVP210_28 [uncultured Caudovirales phage]
MTDQDIADIIWVAVTVLATTSITNNIVGFHLNRIERRINELSEMIEKHGELLKRVARGNE